MAWPEVGREGYELFWNFVLLRMTRLKGLEDSNGRRSTKLSIYVQRARAAHVRSPIHDLQRQVLAVTLSSEV